MSTKMLPMLPMPPVAPVAPTPWPAVAPADPFPPSPQVAAVLERAAKQQAEIDRRKAEELARLRAIQDRD